MEIILELYSVAMKLFTMRSPRDSHDCFWDVLQTTLFFLRVAGICILVDVYRHLCAILL